MMREFVSDARSDVATVYQKEGLAMAVFALTVIIAFSPWLILEYMERGREYEYEPDWIDEMWMENRYTDR